MNAPPAVTRFGRYRVLEELGRGAMGVVYLAEDEVLQRQVAVKSMLLPDDTAERADHEARFLQEAKAAGGLNHPNVITIYELGREGDWLYIAMELLRGTELRELMSLLTLSQAIDIAAQIASGLAAAHEHGVVHRDIKPSNIVVLPGNHAKIMDFGIARTRTSQVKTMAGMMLGSPKYMSPEQVAGGDVDHRCDIFSLGSMLYEMATGTPAFSGNDLGSLLFGIVNHTPPPPSQLNPAVPAVLDLIVAKAMQKDPAARYQHASELAHDLAECRAMLGEAPPPAHAGPAPAADSFSDTQAGAPTQPMPLDSDDVQTSGSAMAAGGRAAAERPQGPAVFALSRHVDSHQALRRIALGRIGSRGRAARDTGRIGWAVAYVLAVVCAIWIAST